jgi:hypothetical protein
MMDNATIVAKLADLLSLYARIEGMKACNQSRLAIGESVGYDENDFNNISYDADSIAIWLMRRGET